MEERTLFTPFVTNIQGMLRRGGSLGDVFSSIPGYQGKVRSLVTDINPEAKVRYAIGMSIAWLGLITILEYARTKGISLMDANEWLLMVVPVACILRKKDENPPPEQPLSSSQKRAGEVGLIVLISRAIDKSISEETGDEPEATEEIREELEQDLENQDE